MKRKLSTLFRLSQAILKGKGKFYLSLLLVLFHQVNASGQSANIFVNPASSSISSGQSFTVTVRFDITAGTINAAEVHLDFNTSRLQVTNITRPNNAQFSSETIALPAGPYNSSNVVNTSGQINYAAGMPAGSTSTDFDLLSITFTNATPVVAGSTTLTLINVPGRRTRAVLGATVATGTLTNGSVSICSAPTATITASAGASICNGQPVALNLSAASGGSPYSLVVNGTTYNNVTVGANFATIPFPTYSMFPSNPTPAIQDNYDGQPIEVGVKFRSTLSGFIKGIRFFKGNTNTESYTGKLYNLATAQLIGSATFSPSTNGWQQVLFATPVSIAANTTYVATYYSASG